MSCLEGIIEFAPDGEESECSTVYSEGQARDQLQEDILEDPEREDDESEDEDPGTIEEDETDNSASDEDDTVTLGGVQYAVGYPKKVLCTQYPSTRHSTQVCFPHSEEIHVKELLLSNGRGCAGKRGKRGTR
jgi:hypothetical protein